MGKKMRSGMSTNVRIENDVVILLHQMSKILSKYTKKHHSLSQTIRWVTFFADNPNLIDKNMGDMAAEVLGLDKRIQLTLDISKIPITEERSPTLQNIKIGAETERRTHLENDLKLKKEEEKKS